MAPNYIAPPHNSPQVPIGPHTVRAPTVKADVVAPTVLSVGTANLTVQLPMHATQSYVMPLASMWQQTSDSWLQNCQQAAREEDVRQQIKKTNLESQQTRELQVTILSWLAEDQDSIALSLVVKTFPNFRIKDHGELVNLLGMDISSWAEIYDPVKDRWVAHSIDMSHLVKRDAVLLLRRLPNGLSGDRLHPHHCPGMVEEMNKLHPVRSKRKCTDLPEPKTSVPSNVNHTPWPHKCLHSQSVAIQDPQTPSSSKMSDTPLTPHPFPDIEPLYLPPVEVPQLADTSRPTTPTSDLAPLLKYRLFCGKRLRHAGERLWPCSFYAQDVIEAYPAAVKNFIDSPEKELSWNAFRNRTVEVIEVADSEGEAATPENNYHSGDGKHSRASSVSLSSSHNSNTHFDFDNDDIPLDPTKVCPYCDEKWPKVPSAELLHQRETLEKMSFPDPGPHSANPLHQQIVPAVCAASFCSLHRFETTVIDIAVREKWPQTVDWVKFENRIWRSQAAIQTIIQDPSSSLFHQILQVTVSNLGSLDRALGSGGRYDFSSKYGNGTG
ncbi:hypothetical protein H0H81_004106 [Sphagnurus paluster]|uniref:Uncharacterized protein n=1 Tax=Sphagnurus paluster TaxID=117069 RepID=A0A9P7GGX2_9AGAR|nr:hypothetical protein H0H81_004106 [Sphagnurus paluster]